MATDANTIRIGLPYASLGAGSGQHQTFIAGIHGSQLTGPAVQVFIDANGQLGTLTAPIASGTGSVAPLGSLAQLREQQVTIAALQRQVQDQQRTNAELRARLVRLEASMTAARSAIRQQALSSTVVLTKRYSISS